MKTNKSFWKKRYKKGLTGWDTGNITEPIKTYIDQLEDRSLNILIPGAGNGHEFIYLVEKGFTNVWAADIVKQPLKNIKKKCPDIQDSRLLHQDFFTINRQFDMILEQTFFCALDPSLRENYVKKAVRLLKPGGKLVGLLFDFELTSDGPPFGGDSKTYRSLFTTEFQINTMERCYNSIGPRADSELFCIFTKK